MFNFKRIDVGDGYSIVEPPAGLVTAINERLKQFSDENDKMSLNIWASIFVLACLHDENNVPVAVTLANNLPKDTTVVEGETVSVRHLDRESLRGVYIGLSEPDYKAIVDDFIFSISKTKLEELYKAVEDSCYITKKATDELKND